MQELQQSRPHVAASLTVLFDAPEQPRVLDVRSPKDTCGATGAAVVARAAAGSLAQVEGEGYVVVHVSPLADLEPLAGAREIARILEPDGVAYVVASEEWRAALAAAGLTDCNLVSPQDHEARLRALGAHAPADQHFLVARRPRRPPLITTPATSANDSMRTSSAQHATASYIVPVFNEEPRLPSFLATLESARNTLYARREFVFVTNGCTDRSAAIIDDWLLGTRLDARRLSSPLGIVSALQAGSSARRFTCGWVGKLDADVQVHPDVLDALEAELLENNAALVAYAEPVPTDSLTAFNVAEHNAQVMSRRLYFTSKACLSRSDVLTAPAWAHVLGEVRAEDIFLSYYLGLYHGLGSIVRVERASVFSKTIRGFGDLVAQEARAKSDIARLRQAWPPFALLDDVFDQVVFDPEYGAVLAKARNMAEYTDVWTRIESAK